MHGCTLLTLFFTALVFTLISGTNGESQPEVEKRRIKNGRPMNPYSWMRGRRSLDDVDFEDGEPVYMPVYADKRNYRRNPYSWQRVSSISDSDQGGFFDTLFGMDKKSPLAPYGNGKRPKNPYWQKYVS